MKRTGWIICLAIFLVSITMPAWALLLGTTNGLPNSNPSTEERWLEGLLNRTYNDPTVNFIAKFEYPAYFYPETNQLVNFNPDILWDWAVVKQGSTWSAYSRDGGGGLTIGSYGQGISHVSFFGVPEPTTMLLLGLGLLGLGITTRRRP